MYERLRELLTKELSPLETCVLFFLLDTGMKGRELCALHESDVRTDYAYLWRVKSAVARESAVIGHHTTAAMKEYLRAETPPPWDCPLFTQDMKGLTTHTLQAILRRIGTSTHELRQLFASQYLAYGGDVSTLAMHLDVLPSTARKSYGKSKSGSLLRFSVLDRTIEHLQILDCSSEYERVFVRYPQKHIAIPT